MQRVTDMGLASPIWYGDLKGARWGQGKILPQIEKRAAQCAMGKASRWTMVVQPMLTPLVAKVDSW
jgi:hypothetical protein